MFKDRILFDTVVGSTAYGTNLPTSDIDSVAVCIPTLEYFYSFKKFEQTVGKDKNGNDRTVYDLRKAVNLMLGNNPNMLDILFTPDRCVLQTSSYWEQIREIQDLFVSKKCRHTYAGYAAAQLDRIKIHRHYLLNPPQKEPLRTDYGLPELPVFPITQLDGIIMLADDFFNPDTKQELMEGLKWIHSDQVLPLVKQHLVPEYREVAIEFFAKGLNSQINAIKSIGNEYINEEYKEMAVKELKYADAMKIWRRYCEWKKSRNKQRAEIEEKFGFDTKHASHLVRLIKMGREILTTGKIIVDRTDIDADELKAIRAGAMKYEQIEEYAKNMDKEFDILYQTSTLPRTPSVEKVSEKLVEIIDQYLKENK